jgi:type I restriction enzyme S subunit
LGGRLSDYGNNPFFFIHFDKAKIDIDFFKHYLKSPAFIKALKNQVKGGIKTEIRANHLLPLRVNIPPLPTQYKVKKYFESFEGDLSDLSGEIENQSVILSKLRQAILQEAIEGKLTADWRRDNPVRKGDVEYDAAALLDMIQEEKINREGAKGKKGKLKISYSPLRSVNAKDMPFAVPEGWVWTRLGEIINIKSGKRIHVSDYRQTGVPFLRSGEIGSLGRGEKIKSLLYISKETYNEIKTKFGIPKLGDILIACIGGSIGNKWVVDEREFYYKDGNLVLLESSFGINTYYLLNYLKSDFFIHNTIKNATDTSYNALTIIKLNEASIPLPPLAEQRAIVEQVEKLLAMVDGLEAQVKERQGQTVGLLQAVLREAFEG